MFVQRRQQSLGFHEVGVYLGAVGEGSDAAGKRFFVALDNEIPAVLGCIPVTELQHLLELPLGVYVHEGEGRLARRECLLGKTHHDAGVLSDAVEHDGVLELSSHFAYDVNGFRLEFFEVGE